MKTNPTKVYLLKYQAAAVQRKILINELKQVREEETTLKGTDYSAVRVQTSPSNDQMINIIIRLEEKSKQIGSRCIECEEVMDQISEEINAVENDTYRSVLMLRYIAGKNLRMVAKELDYDYDYVRELHGKALKYFKVHTKTHNNLC